MAKIDKKEKNTVYFSLEISPEDFENAVQKAYLENRKHIMIPGFRKGHVPRKIIEMNYGSDIFYEDALNEILPTVYEAAVEELDLDVVDQPNVSLPDDIVKGEPIKVEIEVDVKPEVELVGFDGYEVEDIRYEVTDELIENEIEAARSRSARLVHIDDRAIQDDDIVNIDYEGTQGGEVFEGGSDEGIDLHIGSNTFIPGFEEGLVGAEIGEERELELTFPEDYHAEDLAGQDVVFRVKVNDIKVREIPELDDEFVKDVSEFDTVEEYRKDIRETIEKDFALREKQERENAAINAYSDMIELDIPEGMINRQLDQELQEFAMGLSQQGIQLQQYLQIANTDVDGLKEYLRPQAETRLKNMMVLEAIADEQAFEVSDEEVDAEVERLADLYSISEEMKESFVSEMKEGDAPYLREGLKRQKALDYLLDHATFVEKKEEEAEEVGTTKEETPEDEEKTEDEA